MRATLLGLEIGAVAGRSQRYFLISSLGNSTHRVNRPVKAAPAAMISMFLSLLGFGVRQQFWAEFVTKNLTTC